MADVQPTCFAPSFRYWHSWRLLQQAQWTKAVCTRPRRVSQNGLCAAMCAADSAAGNPCVVQAGREKRAMGEAPMLCVHLFLTTKRRAQALEDMPQRRKFSRLLHRALATWNCSDTPLNRCCHAQKMIRSTPMIPSAGFAALQNQCDRTWLDCVSLACPARSFCFWINGHLGGTTDV